jgi:PAS domain S-box-containing protein
MPSSAFCNMIQPCSQGEAGTNHDGRKAQHEPQLDNQDMEPWMALLVENAPIPMAMFDQQMNYMLANRAWIDEFGLKNITPLIGRSQYEVFPNLHPGWRQVYEKALQGHIIRSEQNAQTGDAENHVLYRWEARPWQRPSDASTKGLMITCERFVQPRALASQPHEDTRASAKLSPEMPQVRKTELAAPQVLLDDRGIILQANPAAERLSLAHGLTERKTTFWQAFARAAAEVTLLKSKLLDSFTHLNQPESPKSLLLTLTSIDEPNSHLWLIIKHEASDLYTAIALPTESANLARLASEHRQQQNDLGHSHPEWKALQQTEPEMDLQRQHFEAYLHALPCGVVVLDDMGRVLFQNQQLAQLLGRSMQHEQSMEDWLAAACPDASHCEKVTSLWREDVWRRQLTRCFALNTKDGLLKQLEFQPIGLAGGGLLVCIQDATEKCLHEELVGHSEGKFRAILQESPAAIALLNKAGSVVEVNPAAERLFSQPKSELQRQPIQKWFDQLSADSIASAIQSIRGNGLPELNDLVIQHAAAQDGIPVSLLLAPVMDLDGQPHHTLCFFQPKNQKLTSSVEALTTTISIKPSIENLLLKTNANGRIIECTARGLQLLGLSEAEAIGRALHLHFRPSDATRFYEELRSIATLSGDQSQQITCYSADGQRQDLRVKAYVLAAGSYDFALAEVVNHPYHMEDLATANPNMPAEATSPLPCTAASRNKLPKLDLVRERFILTETHHRIKNHLQVVSSLLNLESNTISDTAARLALQSTQNRIMAMADLNQCLYEALLDSGESFLAFAGRLLHRLRECYDVPEARVQVEFDIDSDAVQHEWLMPLALTLNETLSNCFEHAFPEGRSGLVHATLQLSMQKGELKIIDNGIGIPDDRCRHGHGLKILAVFAEQMHGKLLLNHPEKGGTEVILQFPLENLA